MAKPGGYPIVLTADRTLMAGYRLLFDGMLAASLTSSTPPALLSGLLMPLSPHHNDRAAVAPLGLRRIEAALIAGGFLQDDVVVVDEYHLHDVIGPETKVIGIASGEPAGGGMNSTTMTGVAGGKIYPEVMFQRLINRVRDTIQETASSAKVVLGGPGAWQVADDAKKSQSIGVDYVVTGYAEGNAADIFKNIISGVDLPDVIEGESVSAQDIPPIQGASTMGVVEISRGCGLGCSFCTIARVPMIHLPESTILDDVQINIASGNPNIAILSEDLFRYGGSGVTVNPGALISLLERLRDIDSLRLIQVDHANISSIAQYSDEELLTIRKLIVGNNRHNYPWVNVGIETASGELLKSNGGAPKMGRIAASHWAHICDEQLRRLCSAGFMPMASLVIGLPGETRDDVERMLAWVKGLSNERITMFPVLYAPVNGEQPVGVRDLTKLHWKLIKTCYNLNFKWIPRMYWDNQTGAGVPFAKRALLQVTGRGQVLQWKTLFAWHGLRAIN